MAQIGHTMVSALSKKEVFDLWTVVWERKIKLSPSRLVDIVQEGSNQPIQTEGWPRKFLLQLLSNLPLLFQIKNFSVVDKI